MATHNMKAVTLPIWDLVAIANKKKREHVYIVEYHAKNDNERGYTIVLAKNAQDAIDEAEEKLKDEVIFVFEFLETTRIA